MKAAEEEGRSIGISPATIQCLEIRSLQKVGYRFDPDDLQYWQWKALIEIDNVIEEHKAREIERRAKR